MLCMRVRRAQSGVKLGQSHAAGQGQEGREVHGAEHTKRNTQETPEKKRMRLGKVEAEVTRQVKSRSRLQSDQKHELSRRLRPSRHVSQRLPPSGAAAIVRVDTCTATVSTKENVCYMFSLVATRSTRKQVVLVPQACGGRLWKNCHYS